MKENKIKKIGKGSEAGINERAVAVLNALVRHEDVRQRDLAKDFQMTPAGVSRVKNGTQNVTPYMMAILVEKYNVNPNYLMKGEGDMFEAVEEKMLIPEN